jgi:hypothetical protein
LFIIVYLFCPHDTGSAGRAIAVIWVNVLGSTIGAIVPTVRFESFAVHVHHILRWFCLCIG